MRLGWRRALLLFVASIGCKERAGAAGATSAQASASASASLVKPVSLPPACRAIQVKGDVQSAAGPIALLMPLDGRTWVTLGEGAELALRHGISAREFEVRGPGRFLLRIDEVDVADQAGEHGEQGKRGP